MKIISVGGVAGGASAAARSRRLNENAEIIILEKGPYVSYSNCGLPYHISGQIAAADDLLLVSPEYFKSHYNIEARVQNEVIGVDTAKQELKVKNHADGSTYTESYDKLVLSPGTLAAMPPFAGKDKINIFTLKTVPDLKKLMQFIESKKPQHFTVVGGGLIGLESAENMRLRGLNVTVVEGAKHIIPFVDREMSFFAQKELMDNGVEVIVDDLVESFDTNLVKLKSGRTIKTDGVVMSVGAVPCTGFLKDSGIKLDAKGYIEVNENFQTNAKNVYAIGDAIQVSHQISGEKLPLAMAGPANKQGRFAADHISGKKVVNKGYIGSGVVKLFKLNMAHTGLREEEVKRLGKKYGVVYAAPPGIVGLMPGACLLFSKLIFEQGSGRVLGAQFCSKGQSDKRADIIATAIKANMTVYDLLDL
ncbi:MAG: hypothetical protein B0D92_00190, partial [Spirochaeta sp. LUC14_002_19_P3]